MTQISDALVERMANLLRAIHPSGERAHLWDDELGDECRAIVAELPVPVDPDLVLAREVAQALFPEGRHQTGDLDKGWAVTIALAAIKRVRAGA